MNLWKEGVPFPIYEELDFVPGIAYREVHSASAEDYRFLLGAAIVEHQGALRICWANSKVKENDDQTVLREKVLRDGVIREDRIIAAFGNGYGRSHGVYCKHGDGLYVFCPCAKYELLEEYPALKMEGYRLNADGEYDALGIVLDGSFWPLCEPIALEDGRLIMGGLETDCKQAAVAICDGKDLTRWEMKVLPNPEGFTYWGETTLLVEKNRILALVRGGKGNSHILLSESRDGGESWSGLSESDFSIAHSKLYAGYLSTGQRYLIFNLRGRGNRDTLAIALGKEQFEKVFLIRDGFTAPPKFRRDNQWCYPYAYEFEEKLYIVYAKNKEDCELAILPLESLQ